MHVEQQGWQSIRMNRWMGMRVYGHYGSQILVFSTIGGDEREYKNNGMLDALGHHLEAGKVKFFCVNSVNHESWYNKQAHPRHRGWRRPMTAATAPIGAVPSFNRNAGPRGTATTPTGPPSGAAQQPNSP